MTGCAAPPRMRCTLRTAPEARASALRQPFLTYQRDRDMWGGQRTPGAKRAQETAGMQAASGVAQKFARKVLAGRRAEQGATTTAGSGPAEEVATQLRSPKRRELSTRTFAPPH